MKKGRSRFILSLKWSRVVCIVLSFVLDGLECKSLTIQSVCLSFILFDCIIQLLAGLATDVTTIRFIRFSDSKTTKRFNISNTVSPVIVASIWSFSSSDKGHCVCM